MGIDTYQALNPIDGDRFLTSSLGVVEFIRDKDDRVCGFKFCDAGRIRNIEFKKRSL